ncbi:MAG: DUF2958 domain-containing protein [Mesorhizobium sp.]|nr:MAG: DUF2958 domain-containing protein [Mesorhizobium sp.]
MVPIQCQAVHPGRGRRLLTELESRRSGHRLRPLELGLGFPELGTVRLAELAAISTSGRTNSYRRVARCGSVFGYAASALGRSAERADARPHGRRADKGARSRPLAD